MRYVHKGCSQVRLTAHIVHEWINVSEISRISIFQSWQLCAWVMDDVLDEGLDDVLGDVFDDGRCFG